MTLSRLPALGLALLLGLPAITSASHRDWHHPSVWAATKDWDVLCGARGTRDNRCVAYTEVEGITAGVWGVSNALSISANEPGRYRVGWNPRLYVPDGKHPLHVKVDGRFRRSLSPGRRGYRGNEMDGYRIETTPALIGAMKRGRTLTLSYVDVFGDEREAEFSLMGVTAALRAMDTRLRPPAAAEDEPPLLEPSPRLYRHK